MQAPRRGARSERRQGGWVGIDRAARSMVRRRGLPREGRADGVRVASPAADDAIVAGRAARTHSWPGRPTCSAPAPPPCSRRGRRRRPHAGAEAAIDKREVAGHAAEGKRQATAGTAMYVGIIRLDAAGCRRMPNNYPHPIIAREGWPFLAIAVVAAVALSSLRLWVVAALAWLAVVFIVQFFRDPARDDPAAGEGRARRPPTAASSWSSEARDPYLDRDALKISVFMNVFNVHSQPQPGRRHGRRTAGITPGSFLNAALDKASLENERNALHLRTRRRRRRDLRADRGPHRAPHPLLRRAGRRRSRAASATASSASARASTSTSMPGRRSRSVGACGDVVAGRTSTDPRRASASARRAMVDYDHERARAEEPHPPARHLHPAQPVHAGRAVRRLLRDRAGDEPQLRPGGDRRSSSRWCSTASTAASRA